MLRLFFGYFEHIGVCIQYLATWKHWICFGLQPLKRSGLVVLYIYIIVKFCLCHSSVSGCTATDNPCYSKFLLDQDGITISHVFRLSPWHKCRNHKVINWPTDSILSVETWHFVIKSLFPGSFDLDMSPSGTYEAGGGQHRTAIGTKRPPFSRWVRRWEIYLHSKYQDFIWFRKYSM